jgi:hypothetical protein
MRASLIPFAIAALALPGCGGSRTTEDALLASKVGRVCTVQFRRGDGLGAGANMPVSPRTSNLNGADTCVTGQLTAVGGGWLVLAAGDAEYCIPRESVLLVEFPKQGAAP